MSSRDSERSPLLYGNNEEKKDNVNIQHSTNGDVSTYTRFNAGNIHQGTGSTGEVDSHNPGYQTVQNVPAEKPVQSQPEVKVYTRRFYILALYSGLTFSQAMVWNTWGPISQSAKQVFHWTNGDIALLANWGPIAFIISLFLFSWVMEVKGLRWACLSTSFLIAAGTALRCITFQQPWSNWLIHAGQFLNGLGGPVAMSACTVISSRWFPPNQRTTSTSIGTMINYMGVAVSFIIGPLLVPQHDISCNSTSLWNASKYSVDYSGYDYVRELDDPWTYTSLPALGCPNASTINAYIDEELKGIKKLMYIECGFTGAIFLAILVYFPATPPNPPSLTASIERVNFKTALKKLAIHKPFWLISTIYGVSLGVQNCWMSVLDVNLDPLGVTQDDAGWMGFYSIVAGTIGGMIVARFADIFVKHMKLYLLGLFVLSTVMFLWMTLMSAQLLPSKVVYLYVSVIAGNLCLDAGVPLLYELSCEVTYPIPEAITTSGMALYNNVTGLIFLFIMMIPSIGSVWTSWFLVGSIVICIPVFLLLKENYRRLDIDIEVVPPDEPPNDIEVVPPDKPPILDTDNPNYQPGSVQT